MNRKQLGIAAVLSVIVALEAYAVSIYGYVGFFERVLNSTAGVVDFVDMSIALTLICIWMINDARERSITALPYVIATLALGSPGPLLYLIRRFADRPVENPMFEARPLHN